MMEEEDIIEFLTDNNLPIMIGDEHVIDITWDELPNEIKLPFIKLNV